MTKTTEKMTRSMTGYGKAEAAAGDRKITVEIRSLNSKQLDMSVKLPAAFRAADHELRSRASRVLQRGKVDLLVNIEATAGETASAVDRPLFAHYHRMLGETLAANAIETSGDTMAAALVAATLRMPGVVETRGETADEHQTDALLRATDEALEAIDAFRAREGATLIADILSRIDRIEACMKRIEPYEKARIDSVKNRIRENVEAAGVAVDRNRLEQEIVFWVEKLDITEEKVRLASHCDYFRTTAAEQYAGRKLGFIAQEIGREINTTGSKANDPSIQRIVVEMKDELEKIKEQLLNIL